MPRRRIHPCPETVAILTEARQFIADGSIEYACWAIECAHWTKHFRARECRTVPPDSPAGRLLRRIRQSLGKWPSVAHWLMNNHGATYEQLFTEGGAREYRLRWIDQLIKEYS